MLTAWLGVLLNKYDEPFSTLLSTLDLRFCRLGFEICDTREYLGSSKMVSCIRLLCTFFPAYLMLLWCFNAFTFISLILNQWLPAYIHCHVGGWLAVLNEAVLDKVFVALFLLRWAVDGDLGLLVPLVLRVVAGLHVLPLQLLLHDHLLYTPVIIQYRDDVTDLNNNPQAY